MSRVMNVILTAHLGMPDGADPVQVFVKEQEEDLFRLRYSGGSEI